MPYEQVELLNENEYSLDDIRLGTTIVVNDEPYSVEIIGGEAIATDEVRVVPNRKRAIVAKQDKNHTLFNIKIK